MTTRGTKLYAHLPESPGVYLFRGDRGALLYVGKAGNLRRRVSSYFLRPHDVRLETLVSKIRRIECRKTETALEALMLEARLIKRHEPPFNIREKDDKSFLFVEITKETWPRVVLVRGKNRERTQGVSARFGPFVSASSIREALRIIRRIFPWSTHTADEIGTALRPCFDAEVGLCPGVCTGTADRREYLENIRNTRLIFSGRTQALIRSLRIAMRRASDSLHFEQAARLRSQIAALQHVQDVALIGEPEFSWDEERERRIEGYDISNISGTSAVGSMIVFSGSEPEKKSYRKFRIRTIEGQNDIGMLREVLERRFRRGTDARDFWPLPHCILIDGGAAQVAAAREVLDGHGLRIPVVGIAKGPKRKKNEFFGSIPAGIEPRTLIRVRDEAHRFAIAYHRAVRFGRMFSK